MTDETLGDQLFAAIRRSLVNPTDAGQGPLELDSDSGLVALSYCDHHRVSALMFDAVVHGHIVLPSPIADRLLQKTERALTTVIAAEREAASAYETMSRSGIEVRVVKGLATAHLDYPNPSLRQFGDADLLVPPDQFADALAVLHPQGYELKYPIRGDRWQIQHAVALRADRIEIDLHSRLLHQAAGHLADRADLFGNPVTYEVAGTALKALPPEWRLIQACAQNVLAQPGERKRSSDLDVVLLQRHVADAYRAAGAVDLSWILDLTLDRLEIVLGRAETNASWRSRLLASAHAEGPPKPFQAMTLEALVAPPNTTYLNLRSVVRPGSSYLERRGRTQRSQLLRQLRRMTGRS